MKRKYTTPIVFKVPLVAAICLGGVISTTASSAKAESTDLFSLSLAELTNIKVSSRRQSESYRDVPRSMSVIPEATIDSNNLKSVYDLAWLVPNLSFRRSFGRWQERPVIRGISSITGEQPAGIFIDSTSVKDLSPTLPLFDFERVEVMRGPEASLYGRAPFSGAINFITRRPTSDHVLDLSVTGGSDQRKEVTIYANRALNEQLFVGLAAKSYQKGYSYDNEAGTGGGGYGSETSDYLKLKMLWEIQPGTDVFYWFSKQQDKDGQTPVYLQGSGSNNCFLDATVQYYCGEIPALNTQGYNHSTNVWDFGLNRDSDMHHLEVNINRGPHEFKAMYSMTDTDFLNSDDGDYYELDKIFSTFKKGSSSKSLDTFANLQYSNVNVLFGLSHYVQDETTTTSSAFRVGESLFVSNGSDRSTDIINTSVFSSVIYNINKTTHLNVDMRLSKDTIEYNIIENTDNKNGSNSWKTLSPRINLSKTIESWLIYGAIANGFKPGGFNELLEEKSYFDKNEKKRVFEFLSYDEEKIISYEIGLKGELTSINSLLTTNIFYYDWQDLQLTQSLSYIDDDNDERRISTTINGGKAVNYGGEIELETVISDHLSTKLNLGYTHTKLKNTETTAQEDLTGSPRVDGNKIPNTPRVTAYAGTYYRYPINDQLSFSMTTSLQYESKRYVAEHNFAEIESSLSLNFMLSLSNESWRLDLWGKNINDNNAPESVARFGDAATGFSRAFAVGMANEPQYGLTLKRTY